MFSSLFESCLDVNKLQSFSTIFFHVLFILISFPVNQFTKRSCFTVSFNLSLFFYVYLVNCYSIYQSNTKRISTFIILDINSSKSKLLADVPPSIKLTINDFQAVWCFYLKTCRRIFLYLKLFSFRMVICAKIALFVWLLS